MTSPNITEDKDTVINTINAQTVLAEKLLDRILTGDPLPSLELEWESWQTTTGKMLERYFTTNSIASSFLLTSMLEKSISSERKEKLTNSLTAARSFLRGLCADIESELHAPQKLHNIDAATAYTIIRRILNNFHKHLETMYYNPVHGNGKIKVEDLNRIKIGNEYDVQRILYSLIRPIFPESRLEVTQDTGYRSVRYDIYMDEYDLIIEVKCTRPSMKERALTEELGADAFHYQSENLFLFIFDKDKIISNIDAFKTSYSREKITFGKNVEVYVVQPIVL